MATQGARASGNKTVKRVNYIKAGSHITFTLFWRSFGLSRHVSNKYHGHFTNMD